MAKKAVWPLPLLHLTQVGVAAVVWSDSILCCLEQCKGQEEASGAQAADWFIVELHVLTGTTVVRYHQRPLQILAATTRTAGWLMHDGEAFTGRSCTPA